VRASKHEGTGNDFIVVLDPADALRLTVGQVRLLCDRRRGVGADGIIRVGPGRQGADLSMELRNADGGTAEMSGNGIRCLAQAAVDGGLVSPPRFTVATAAGIRTVDFVAGESPGWARASVDMGPVTLGPDQPQDFENRKARTADVGNPHLVLFGPEVATVDVAVLGPKLQSPFEDGINVEWICLAGDGVGDGNGNGNGDGNGNGAGRSLDLRVWERGAGETLACGTGSVAAAAAARSWGVVDPDGPVRVHNPGGTLEVTLGARPGDPAFLAGPVRKVADIDIHPGLLS
jgi:diaminopimelate epimerase